MQELSGSLPQQRVNLSKLGDAFPILVYVRCLWRW